MIHQRSQTLLRRIVARTYITGFYNSIYAKRFQNKFKQANNFPFIEPSQTKDFQTPDSGAEIKDAHSWASYSKSMYKFMYLPGKPSMLLFPVP